MTFVTLEDVISFAIEREDTAYKLYKRAAELSTSIAAKKMFEQSRSEKPILRAMKELNLPTRST